MGTGADSSEEKSNALEVRMLCGGSLLAVEEKRDAVFIGEGKGVDFFVGSPWLPSDGGQTQAMEFPLLQRCPGGWSLNFVAGMDGAVDTGDHITTLDELREVLPAHDGVCRVLLAQGSQAVVKWEGVTFAIGYGESVEAPARDLVGAEGWPYLYVLCSSLVFHAVLLGALLLRPVQVDSVDTEMFDEPDRWAELILNEPEQTESTKNQTDRLMKKLRGSAEYAPGHGGKIAAAQRALVQQKFSKLFAGGGGTGSMLGGGGSGVLSGTLSNLIGTSGQGTASAGLGSPSDLRARLPQSPPGPRAAAVVSADSVDPTRFQAAKGYWANRYLPGDPALRILRADLRHFDRTLVTGASAALDELARQPTQPFDPPSYAAVGLYLHASQASVTGPKRLLVQVGIKGAERRSVVRPPMRVAVVLDAPGTLSTEQRTEVRSLLSGLAKGSLAGDHLALWLAGERGGLALDADQFRNHGTSGAFLAVLEGKWVHPHVPAGLSQVLSEALRSLEALDDPTAPLGASTTLVVSHRPLNETLGPGELETLEAQLHEAALSGLTTSAVRLSGSSRSHALERLVLAGQGSRHVIQSPQEAASAASRVLHSTNRVVARALRLRIRLAAGVELVDVLGSYPLDAEHSERTRKQEKKIDQRMARNLGVTSDRGEDDDGIQIVIPSFYAGDSHVILLDVEVPGPGPVAAVTARYKDLVHLENGFTQASLRLARGRNPVGALEANVRQNRWAHELSEALTKAGEHLARNDSPAAIQEIAAARERLRRARVELERLHGAQDMARDAEMLRQYEDAVTRHASYRRIDLASSLRYAGYMKRLPRPAH